MDFLSYFLNLNQQNNPFAIMVGILLMVWSFFWKGVALWHSSQNKSAKWFVAILILNTVGIVEILYLFVFAKEKFDFQKFLAKATSFKSTNRN